MDGMDEQARAHQIWLESQNQEPDPYNSYAGQEVFCPYCDRYVSIVTKIKDHENFSEFTTSCGDGAQGSFFGDDDQGSFSDGYNAKWCFWIN